ncbi:flagellar export chaperone FliS [Cellulomonas sp. URHB0016]
MTDIRSRYMTDAVATVGPARLLTMLYDRMLVDVDRAVEALVAGDVVVGRGHLQHAQEIVAELMVSLDEGAWASGTQLMSIYKFLFTELIDAATHGDVDKARACRGLVAPLAEAWHEAARSLSAADVPTQPSAPAAETATSVGLLGVG